MATVVISCRPAAASARMRLRTAPAFAKNPAPPVPVERAEERPSYAAGAPSRRDSIHPQAGHAKTSSITPSSAAVMAAASSLVTGWTSLSAWWFISAPHFGHVILALVKSSPALVLGDRPLRTGTFFYVGALSATLAIGIIAAFVIGDVAASSNPSTPKTSVAVIDVALSGLLLIWVARIARTTVRPGQGGGDGGQDEWSRVVSVDRGVVLFGIAVVGAIAFYLRERRAGNPLYDLDVAARRVFWVAACAGNIVFGSLMGAAFISQQYLQNVLDYSTLEAGAAILPAALLMVVVAPRSAKLVEARGHDSHSSPATSSSCWRSSPCSCCGRRTRRTGRSGSRYVFIGIGVGLAGTPASHSLTGSVPVDPCRDGVGNG